MQYIFKVYTKENLGITGAILLSTEEAEELLTKEERKYYNCWWLRSPGYDGYVACVEEDGNIYKYGFDIYPGENFRGKAVRPALEIFNLENSSLKIGDVFKIGKYKFKIISPELAWLYRQKIGTEHFDKHSNLYENSSIGSFVDDWYYYEIRKKVEQK